MEYDLSKYTYDWFENASIDELEEEREYVRSQIYCNSAAGYDLQCKAQKLLDIFDNYLRRKKDDGTEWAPPKSTRHGWYLPDDDDD